MSDTPTSPPFMRIREVSEVLGMSTDTAYAHVRSGTFPIPVVKVGSIYKARRSDVDAFVNGPSNAPD